MIRLFVNRLGTLVLVLNLSSTSFAQVGFDKLIKNLQDTHYEGVISGKSFTTKVLPIPQESKCYVTDHQYLWYKNNLVVQTEGTGRLYQVSPDLKIKRLDSTCFEGYNFGAFNFVFRDTIFSLGGYGFWQFNGMLRFFDEKTGGWEVVKTNKTVPVMQLLYSKPYYDIADKKIYFIFHYPKQHYQDSTFKYDRTLFVQCLDLITKKWWDEDKLFNTKIVPGIEQIAGSGPFHHKDGMIFRHDYDVIVLDFKSNKVKRVIKNTKEAIDARLSKTGEALYYAKNESLHFYDPANGLIDSVPFSSKDLIDTDIPLYTSINKVDKVLFNPIIVIVGTVSIIVVLLIVWLFIRNKNLRNRVEFLMSSHLVNGKKGNGEIAVANTDSFRDNLTEVEKGLIDLLVANTSKNEMTSVTQMNQVLGISSKPLKIQNNIRASTIQLINKKFMIFSGTSDELIEKQRTEFDKRFFEYSIQRKYLSKVK